MTDNQRKFADEYLIDCNAARAYMAAYTRVKNNVTAAALAARLMKKENIRAYIEEKLEEISSAKVADVQEVMEYLTSVMRGESTAEIVVVEGEGDGISSARRMSKAPDERERLKAAELLGKRYAIFSDKLNMEGALPVVISGADELED
jgi:phage terminase small subunit